MPEMRDKDNQYSRLLNYNKMDGSSKIRLVIVFRTILLLFFGTIAIILVMNIVENYNYFSAIAGSITDKKLIGVKISKKPNITPPKFNFKMLRRYQNILLLGVDSNGPNTLPFSGVRSDTIMIISVDNHAGSVNVISVPRDSKVYLSDEHGIQKINAAYAIGGIKLAEKTLEETLGIKIHNYIIFNSEGLRKIIDIIGGVPIHIDKNMDYDDNSGNLHIHFRKGKQILDGRGAEGYLRYRRDMLGDIGRVQRQQKFINALIEKIKQPETLKKIPEALKIAGKYSKTDLNMYQMPQYASFARDLDLEKLQFASLPGAPNKKGNISYWILDPEKTQEMINSMIYRHKNAIRPLSISIVYAPGREAYADKLTERFKAAGYGINSAGMSSSMNEPALIGCNNSVSPEIIKELKRKIPETESYRYIQKSYKAVCRADDIVVLTGSTGG